MLKQRYSQMIYIVTAFLMFWVFYGYNKDPVNNLKQKQNVNRVALLVYP